MNKRPRESAVVVATLNDHLWGFAATRLRLSTVAFFSALQRSASSKEKPDMLGGFLLSRQRNCRSDEHRRVSETPREPS